MKKRLYASFICGIFVLINSMTAHADMYYQKLLQEGWTPLTHENMDIAEKSDSIFGVWRRGSEANTKEIPKSVA